MGHHQLGRLILLQNSYFIMEILGGYNGWMNEDTQTIRNLGLFVLGIGGLIFILGIVAYLLFNF